MLTYQLLIHLLSPLVFFITVLEAIKKQGGLAFILERLGLKYPEGSLPNLSPIWIHCASVGEVKAAEPLIHKLLLNHSLLITTNTPTGHALIERLFNEKVLLAYCPVDYPYAIHRFLNHYYPSKLWVMETEIWPNLYREAHKKGIEISILNARLSRKTLNSPAWLKQAYQQTLALVSHLLVRNEQEASHFRQLNANNNTIQVLGNLKYAAIATPVATDRPIERPYILLASSHDNEETEVTQRWLSFHRAELLVIVPRHPKRADEIVKNLPLSRDQIRVYSKNEMIDSDTLVYIDDQIGALDPLFCHAKVVIMGGAFVPKGGHNVLEPAACGATILTGPDMSDFEEETQLLKSHQGLIQCSDYDSLFQELNSLIDAPGLLNKMGENAKQALQNKMHILEDYLTILLPEHKQ
ncbi:3-deoxy-D-manno-octulosonic acid transferase [Hydrogenovibrio kuenenii]|uniref:3-deoxy-D-manno-octulosonic acid transferase n=1 Tax=Hydrogenovibrio kuenenii TaxID=63658 RepID=UPI000463BB0A|nr:glycosyltransferase N-terminal domain-containing protein [Hydrogenovibrio kuenenii]